LSGAPLSVAVNYAKVYVLTFIETTLPQGTNWSVTLTGSASAVILVSPPSSGSATLTRWSDGASTIRFYLSNGAYSYSASAPGHSSGFGSLTVSGSAAAPVTVSFPSSSSSSSGLSSLGYLIVGVVMVAVAILVVTVPLRRREKAPHASAVSSSHPGHGTPPAPP
jgi:hypothetical protein